MSHHPNARRQRGLTLVELMVAMAVGLCLALAVTTVLIVSEGHKRATTAVNDREQSGAFAALLLDRMLRNAGSGLAQTVSVGGYGCALAASKNGAPILPVTAWPEPFGAFPAAPRVAPALIQKGADNASDIIMVMAGSAAAGDMPRPLRAGGDASQILLDGTLQLKGGDLVLLTSGADCRIDQVKDGFEGNAGTARLELAGAYHANNGAPLPGMVTGAAYLSVLGNSGAAPNYPHFMLYGVSPHRVLAGYDMLQMEGSAVHALADGVERLYALYGVDTEGRGKVSEWVDPSGDWAIDALAADPARLRKILAIRFALVLRSSAADKTPAAQADRKLVIFGDLGENRQRTLELSDDDRRYRYQVIDAVVPLRNALLAFPS